MPPRNLQMRMALIALSNHCCSRCCEAAARLERGCSFVNIPGRSRRFHSCEQVSLLGVAAAPSCQENLVQGGQTSRVRGSKLLFSGPGTLKGQAHTLFLAPGFSQRVQQPWIAHVCFQDIMYSVASISLSAALLSLLD